MVKSKKPKGAAKAPRGGNQKSSKGETVASKSDYQVGHGRPPLHTRFKKGDKRKRPGRPRGSKNLSTIIMDAARDHVSVTISGKTRKISKLQATAIQLANKGANGDPKAMGQFLDRIEDIEARAAVSKPTRYPFSEADLEVVRAVYNRLSQFKPREE